MNIMDTIRSRHSVRQYLTTTIEADKRAQLDELAKKCNEESGLNIQITYDDPACFGGFLVKAMFKGCQNYISIVGSQADPKLEEKAGYYGEQIVLKAQELGLNTCWVGLTHGKGKYEVKANEKLVIMIALGYGANQGKARKSKTIADVSNVKEDLPDWYKAGVEAALLAPTAINQQKFRFSLVKDQVSIQAMQGPYSMVDLGIVKYHFEAVSGHKCE